MEKNELLKHLDQFLKHVADVGATTLNQKLQEVESIEDPVALLKIWRGVGSWTALHVAIVKRLIDIIRRETR